MAKKEKTLSKLKADLDAIFSRFIRLRNADYNGYNTCITCGVNKHWKELQNGHFMSRRHLNTRWDEDNCQVQCYSCNVMNQGRQFEYSIWLDNKHGKGKSEELMMKSKELNKFDRHEIQKMILEYRQEVDFLLNYIGEL